MSTRSMRAAALLLGVLAWPSAGLAQGLQGARAVTVLTGGRSTASGMRCATAHLPPHVARALVAVQEASGQAVLAYQPRAIAIQPLAAAGTEAEAETATVFGGRDQVPDPGFLEVLLSVPEHQIYAKLWKRTAGPMPSYHFDLLGPGGVNQGRFIFSYYRNEAGLRAHIDRIIVDNPQQAIGSHLLAAFEDLNHALGVTEVGLRAGMEVGTYAWARYGFDAAAEKDLRTLRWEVKAEVGRVVRATGVPEPRAIEILRAENARIDAIVHSWELADYTYAGFPVGKSALLDSEKWDAVLRRTPGDPTYERFRRYLATRLANPGRVVVVPPQ